MRGETKKFNALLDICGGEGEVSEDNVKLKQKNPPAILQTATRDFVVVHRRRSRRMIVQDYSPILFDE